MCCKIDSLVGVMDSQPQCDFGDAVSGKGSDIDDYLANLSVGFEEARRFLDLFKRERARDDWLQLPRREPLGDESFCTLESSFVVRDLSIQIALQRQALA